MVRKLLVIYDTNADIHNLAVVDPEEQLPNGNYKAVKVLIGGYADDIYKELTEDKA